MRAGFWFVVAAFALAACAEDVPTMKWSKPGATYDEFVADRAACVQLSKAQSKTYYVGGVRYTGNRNALDSGAFLPCMHDRGYAPDPKGYAAPPGEEMPLSP
ncbi:MAG TPA: hypothetical protein VHT03_04500 [Rhizomicrobium sp.]|jgi:hypothetical protein|nr:hypothetical protein [Rhizomicrobium sp.]